MEKTNFYDAIYSPVILILNAIVVAVVMLLSATGNHQVLKLFGMSAGTAVAIMNAGAFLNFQIFTPEESLGMEIQTIQSAVAGIHRINEFFALDEKQISSRMKNGEFLLDKSVSDHVVSNEKTSDVIEDFEKDALNQNTDQNMQNVAELPFVEFRNVTFGYDEHVVLGHLNFQVKTGEQVILSGRTGAGKSTIMKLLLGLYEPQSGEILLRRVPVTQIQEEDRRNIYGYVEQTFHMVPGTVRDQITLYDPRISDQQVKAVTEPELLLLDEITANLDAETELEILQALKRVSQNRTVISISHRTSAEMGRIIEI
ncbi:ATP-binding cassette domain-containing protein [Eubacterium ramulus]|uniref:ATP-binding cassette domain-containing protein n=1 Tax=Eubacterium ramulus TaxID=39490 RepID=UPI00350E54CF